MAGSNKTTTASTVPAYLSEAGKSALNRATSISNIGYTPYYGPDVAAMTPAELAAMQGTNTAASAFGLPTVDIGAGMPTAGLYDGMPAYSSGAGYDAAIAELKARFPAQFAAIMGQFIDPVTGQMAGSAARSTQMGLPVRSNTPAYGNTGNTGGGGGGVSPTRTSGTGYTSIRDMFDGGGMGKSGSTFSGGLLSNLANKVGVSPTKSSQKSTVTRQSGR